MFKLSKRSYNNLTGIRTELVHVVCKAIEITEVDFVVTEGLRTKERQAELFEAGKSQTMNSYHLTGEAVDLAALIGGTVSWDMKHYRKIADSMLESAGKLGIDIEWGGNWISFKDGPHFQLKR